MLLSEYVKEYGDYSKRLSEITRSLAFAGIAIIWVFRVTDQPTPQIPDNLLLPLGLFAICLAFDLLQYIYSTTLWGIYVYVQDKKYPDSEDDPDLTPPHWWEVPAYVFYFLKVLSILLAYVFLIKFIWSIWIDP
jgi:hypothetical protein